MAADWSKLQPASHYSYNNVYNLPPAALLQGTVTLPTNSIQVRIYVHQSKDSSQDKLHYACVWVDCV